MSQSQQFEFETEETRPLTTRALAPSPERRQRRSEDVITALHYQLAATRSAADLEAVVLVDDHGCLVAGAGAWPLCEELAAYAPLFGRPTEIAHKRVSSRVAQLAAETDSVVLDIDGAEVVLCVRGGADNRRSRLAEAAAGCKRILAS